MEGFRDSGRGDRDQGDISGQLENVGEHFGQLGDDVEKWGDSFGTLEQRRSSLEESYSYMQDQAKRLGGVSRQGAPPSQALPIQAATQLITLLIQSLAIRVFDVELDAVTLAQIVLVVQALVALVVSTYLNKVKR